jgi:hypothetical protein
MKRLLLDNVNRLRHPVVSFELCPRLPMDCLFIYCDDACSRQRVRLGPLPESLHFSGPDQDASQSSSGIERFGSVNS